MDGVPYPVNCKSYGEIIKILNNAVKQVIVYDKLKLDAIKWLKLLDS